MSSMGQVLMVAWAAPGRPCSTPGPETVSSAAGVPCDYIIALLLLGNHCESNLVARCPAASRPTSSRRVSQGAECTYREKACGRRGIARRLLIAEADEADARRLSQRQQHALVDAGHGQGRDEYCSDAKSRQKHHCCTKHCRQT